MNRFKNADKAFSYYKKQILDYGIDFDDTKALFNVGFTITKPMDNLLNVNNVSGNGVTMILNGIGILPAIEILKR